MQHILTPAAAATCFRAEDPAATLEQLVEEERITYHNGRFRLNAEAQ